MSNTTEQSAIEVNRGDAKVFASVFKRGEKWTSARFVAHTSGLSFAESMNALRELTEEDVLERRFKFPDGVFRVRPRAMNSRRAELEYEARGLRLIDGPRMKPLFGPTRRLHRVESGGVRQSQRRSEIPEDREAAHDN